MSGSFGEMGSLLQQAQKMQRELDRVREELRNQTVEGIAGGGVVRVLVTGDRNVKSVEFSEEILATVTKEDLEELTLAALRDGIQKAAAMAEEALGRVTGGVHLPGLF